MQIFKFSVQYVDIFLFFFLEQNVYYITNKSTIFSIMCVY